MADLPSGQWVGHFVDPRTQDEEHPVGHKWPLVATMTFEDGGQSFHGAGKDNIGPFEFTEGKVTGGTVRFVKAYSTHSVIYEGVVSGNQFLGQWWLASNEDVRGIFSIWPDLPCPAEESGPLPSGKWAGHFVDPRNIDDDHPAGHKWPLEVVMNFDDTKENFEGTGVDEIGPFEFKEGKVVGGALISFTKTYATHSVGYRGILTGSQVLGEWWLTGATDVRGYFSMWPEC